MSPHFICSAKSFERIVSETAETMEKFRKCRALGEKSHKSKQINGSHRKHVNLFTVIHGHKNLLLFDKYYEFKIFSTATHIRMLTPGNWRELGFKDVL